MSNLIGNAPNQVPTNADLGGLAFQHPDYVNIGGGSITANLTLSGNILGDFTNATLNSRASFVTNVANSTTGIYAIPSGSATAASWQAANNNDLTNASKILIATNGTVDTQLVSGRNGTGTYLPLRFWTNGQAQLSLDTNGNLVLISATDSVSTTTGALVVAGGVGVAANVTVGGNIFINSANPALTANSVVTKTYVDVTSIVFGI